MTRGYQGIKSISPSGRAIGSHMTCVHCACHVFCRCSVPKQVALFGARINLSLPGPIICTLRSLGTSLHQKTRWLPYLLRSRQEEHFSNIHPAGIFGTHPCTRFLPERRFTRTSPFYTLSFPVRLCHWVLRDSTRSSTVSNTNCIHLTSSLCVYQ